MPFFDGYKIYLKRSTSISTYLVYCHMMCPHSWLLEYGPLQWDIDVCAKATQSSSNRPNEAKYYVLPNFLDCHSCTISKWISNLLTINNILTMAQQVVIERTTVKTVTTSKLQRKKLKIIKAFLLRS